jgi:aminopeptidase N
MKKTYLLTALFSLFLFTHFLKANTKSLGDSLDIYSYSIHLNIVSLSSQTIGGYTDLKILPKMGSVKKIQLQLLKLNVDSIFYNQNKVANYGYNDTLIRFTIPGLVTVGDTMVVRIYYHGIPQVDPSGFGGFYFSSDTAFAYNLGVAFESEPHSYGRVWFPCFDEFPERAFFDYYITVKSNRMAVCGGLLQNVTTNSDNTKTYHWKMQHTIPSYLASVAVGNYTCVTDTFQGIQRKIPINIYVPPAYTTNVSSSFVNLKSILTIYESRFGPYLWERVGYVGVPFSGGAMEHSTNIAYPLFGITSNTAYESLYAHELSHQWFGDLITCYSEQDMWINEGWASFCEAVFTEGLYGEQAYKDYVNANHLDVIQTAHIEDNGYRAVFGIPAEYTYGKTVYDKGADMVFTLRNYMGDTQFFDAVIAMNNQYKFNDISTIQMRDFLSSHSGINLSDFFSGWILQPGFPHFSIDSMKITSSIPPYKARVWVRQKLNHATNFVNSNKLEITFATNQWQFFTDTLKFSGGFGSKEFTLPFVPDLAMMDFNQKVSDAITDYIGIIKTTGTINSTQSLCNLIISSAPDSALVRIEHNWVAPDPLKTSNPDIKRLSDYHYWKVDGIFPGGFVTKAKFKYQRTVSSTTGNLDDVLLSTTSSADSLLLLYRRDAAHDWNIEPFTKSGNSIFGYLVVDTLKKGEYAFAIGKPYHIGIFENKKDEGLLKIFPNPANNQITFSFLCKDEGQIIIYDSMGLKVQTLKTKQDQQSLIWNCSGLPAGNYIVKLNSKKGTIAQEKLCVLK